jgi:hypothetical protein
MVAVEPLRKRRGKKTRLPRVLWSSLEQGSRKMMSHPYVTQELARSRHDDLLREAVRYRLAAEAAPTESRIGRALSALNPVVGRLRSRAAAPSAIAEPA